MLSIEQFVCGPLENNAFVLASAERKSCLVVDCPIAPEPIHEFIEAQGLKVEAILLTHGHFDHLFSLTDFKRRYGAPVYMHEGDLPSLNRLVEIATHWGVPGAEAAPQPDHLLKHGELLTLCGVELEVRHTPGHCPGQVAFVLPGHAFVGDTLFYRSIGRYDLPGSSFEELKVSIEDKLYSLPDETIVWPGHGPETTIGDERRLNPYFGDNARLKPKP